MPIRFDELSLTMRIAASLSIIAFFVGFAIAVTLIRRQLSPNRRSRGAESAMLRTLRSPLVSALLDVSVVVGWAVALIVTASILGSCVGCSRAPDEAAFDEEIVNQVIALEPYSHGRTVILAEETLTSLPPSLSAHLRQHLGTFYPTLRITSRSASESGGNELSESRGVSQLGIVVEGTGARREIECSLVCGPRCGIGFRTVLEWRGGEWSRGRQFPILY